MAEIASRLIKNFFGAFGDVPGSTTPISGSFLEQAMNVLEFSH